MSEYYVPIKLMSIYFKSKKYYYLGSVFTTNTSFDFINGSDVQIVLSLISLSELVCLWFVFRLDWNIVLCRLRYPNSYIKSNNPDTAAATPKYRNVIAVDPTTEITYPPIKLPLPKMLILVGLKGSRLLTWN